MCVEKSGYIGETPEKDNTEERLIVLFYLKLGSSNKRGN
jgi:hypothetical protein